MKKLLQKVSVLAIALALVVMTLSLWGCSDSEHIHSADCDRVSVSVLYTSDVHGRIESDASVFGIDRIAWLKSTTENSVLVDAGDFLHGLPIATLTEGKNIVSLMAEAGYQVAAVGNHEFNYGKETLLTRANEGAAAGLNIITANVKTADNKNFLPATHSLEIAGVKIGFLGLTTQETGEQARPSDIAGLTFEDPVSTGTTAAADLKAQGCDIVIALSHIGSNDYQSVKSSDIAAIEDIDAVIDGHSHVVLDTKVGDTPLVSPGSHASGVGKLTVTLLHCQDDYEIESFKNYTSTTNRSSLDDVLAETDTAIKTKIGELPFQLDAPWPDVRTKEIPLGNFLADSLLFSTGADVSIFNGGNIRTALPKGDVSYGNVITTSPFFNQIVVKSVTGAQLKTILEHSYAEIENAKGQFAQIGGMKVTLNVSAAAGSRIQKLEIKNKDGSFSLASDTAVYSIAINDYLASGGDGYPILGSLPIDLYCDTEVDTCIEYINGCEDFSVYEKAEGRIIFL